jgi:hypothetical protein
MVLLEFLYQLPREEWTADLQSFAIRYDRNFICETWNSKLTVPQSLDMSAAA